MGPGSLLLSWVLLNALVIGEILGDSVTQSPPEETVLEGESMSFDCQYETTSDYPNLFWYLQSSGAAPEFILRRNPSSVGEKEPGTRFSAKLDKENRTVPMWISDVKVSDSGTYYCSFNTGLNKLTFGRGTVLRVKPNIKNSAPSAYVLKPAAGSEDQVGTACLVTDFSPAGNVTVYLNETEKGVRPATLVESEKKWSYGIVEWSPKKQDDQFKCRAEYKGQTIEAQEWKEDTQKSCSVISVSEYFETDEKLNTLSLTVLGLKIVFMKSIAFNLLMTLRLWTS